ncbi:class I SAM-dependent methyltransferase [Clostridium botulinum]|uniref:class I SAM-dependent methyltransferase n=1 Tax=Clostridium botulinum TaxID=1491 RepID=UPI003DA4CA22
MNNRKVIMQNEIAWDKRVNDGICWTVPVTSEDIEKARNGVFGIKLTAIKNVPRKWFPQKMEGLKILCLACGGGQQAPILAATGANVTVLDISLNQLKQDEFVASREDLNLKTVQGDMCDLSQFNNNSFDMVYCPVSVTYIPDVLPVFKESYRVLKKGGLFLFGAVNPFIYLFNGEKWDKDIFEVTNKLPFNSFDELDEKGIEDFIRDKNAIEYSHTLEALIGGQTKVGFLITDFYEDVDSDKICEYSAKYFATKAIK